MNYTDVEQWVDNIDIINPGEKVLGGLDGPTNRPTKQLANRTAWLKKQVRIPIYEDLMLNVSATGDDATGDYTGKPFRQPQAAINYAIANLDFRNVRSLTINVAAGTYTAFIINRPIHGLRVVQLRGAGVDLSFIPYITNDQSNVLSVSGFTLNGNEPVGLTKIDAFNNALINLDGPLKFINSGMNPLYAIRATLGASVSAIGATFTIENRYVSFVFASIHGYIQIVGCTLNFTNGCQLDNGIVEATRMSHISVNNNNWQGASAGKKYNVETNSVIITGGGAVGWPAALDGTASTGGIFI